MDSKADDKAARAGLRPAGPLEVQLSSEPAGLIQKKAEVLGRARELQVELAGVRDQLTRLDQEMLRAGLHMPELACW